MSLYTCIPALVTMVMEYSYQIVSDVQKEPQPIKDASVTSIMVEWSLHQGRYSVTARFSLRASYLV